MKFYGKLITGAMILSILAGCSIDKISNNNSLIPSENNNSSLTQELSSTTNNSSNTNVSSNNNSSANNDSSIVNSNTPSSGTNTENSSNNNTNLDATWTYTGNYYDGINFNSGDLASQISELITKTHAKNTTYSGLASLFKESDRDPNDPSKILWFYTGTSVSFSSFGGSNGATNREHVFPKNAGKAFPEESDAGSDGHHLRPTECQMNSTRGNKSFGEVEQSTSNIVRQNGSTTYNSDKDKLCYTNSTYFYPGKGYRGQTARILFYVVSRWGKQYNLSFVDGAGSNKTIGDISTLLKWNLEEPVSETEIHRNNVVAKKQGNRNPFIDNPSFACSIFGSVSNKAKAACAKANQVTPPGENNNNNDSSDNNSSPNISEDPSSENNSSTPDINQDSSSNNNQESSGGYIPPSDGKTYALVTKESDLVENGKYIIACASQNVAMGYLNGNQYAASINVNIINNMITLTNEEVTEYTLSGSKDAYKLTCSEGILGVTSEKKLNYTQGTNTWKITISDNIATIASTNSGCGTLQYNSQAPRFTTYKSTQQAVSLYKLI